MAKPFLKWAGGKRELAEKIIGFFPPEKIETYYEPFLGGGAVFFEMAERSLFKRAVLGDSNAELMRVYRVLRDFPEELIVELLLIWKASPKHYARIRAMDGMESNVVRRAARTIYLNKFCFNGLYRVNKRGDFNVPYGKLKKPPALDEEGLRLCSRLLEHFVELREDSFALSVMSAGRGDLVYFDPPYVPASKSSRFTGYTKEGFGDAQQVALASLALMLRNRGASVVLSASDTPRVRELYGEGEMREWFQCHEVEARRSINSKGEKRGPVGELIIVGVGPRMKARPARARRR
jgi:DNA adenine methylase